MPITISLLNSLSGIAGAIAGMAVYNPLLVAVGGIVGASGLFLTQIMCRSMNRSLSQILLGKKPAAQKIKATFPASTAAESTGNLENSVSLAAHLDQAELLYKNQENSPVCQSPEIAAGILLAAKKVIIIPGYGMALAQAQSLVKKLSDILESNSTEVLFAIHPVAGRMPGHMNVLLCEVDIPYDQLHEMDEINPQFRDCDAVVIVGANDVVNPAANTAEGTPIFGMPILNAEAARHVIICNYDLKPGYAGVGNPLYGKNEGVTLLLGDAKESLTQILLALSDDTELTALTSTSSWSRTV
jgi:NAD(P) transhydrogenase subunit beta